MSDDILEIGGRGPAPVTDSPLAALKAQVDARARAGAPSLTLPVPTLDGVRIRFRCQVSGAQRDAWSRQATAKGRFKVHEFAYRVIAHCCDAILIGDEPMTNDDGVAVTFASPEVRSMVGASGSFEAVEKLIANDGACVAMATDVMAEAGWSSLSDPEDEPADPT